MLIKAQSILIILGPSINFDTTQAIVALCEALSKAKKNYSVWVLNQNFIKTLQAHSTSFTIPIFQPTTKNDLILTLDNFSNKVLGVKWQQINHKVVLYFTVENKNFNEYGLNISKQEHIFDSIIFVGLAESEQEFLNISSYIDKQKTKITYLKEKEDSILPLEIYNFITKEKLNLEVSIAQKLLESIYKVTQNFTKNKTSRTFLIASKLTALIDKAPISNVTPKENKIKTQEMKPDNNQMHDKKKKDSTDGKDTLEEKRKTRKDPISYDPLTPASQPPEPLILNKKTTPKPKINTPLPEANS